MLFLHGYTLVSILCLKADLKILMFFTNTSKSSNFPRMSFQNVIISSTVVRTCPTLPLFFCPEESPLDMTSPPDKRMANGPRSSSAFFLVRGKEVRGPNYHQSSRLRA